MNDLRCCLAISVGDPPNCSSDPAHLSLLPGNLSQFGQVVDEYFSWAGGMSNSAACAGCSALLLGQDQKDIMDSSDLVWSYTKKETKDDKGDASAETTGPASEDISAGLQSSTERLAALLAYP
ncbi:hypothetical protein V6N11_009354 [Hibiscus sabdariffa]|uniref:Uncharacterized protein n=1 Tax=Hibiscus sabdariffa TaxID=183260 RepID=A0ABR2NSS3_9ROSI